MLRRRGRRNINSSFCNIDGLWKSTHTQPIGTIKRRQDTGKLPWYMIPVLPETLTEYGLLEVLRARCISYGKRLKEDELWEKAYQCAETEGAICTGVGINKKHPNGDIWRHGGVGYSQDTQGSSADFGEPGQWTCYDESEGL